MELQESFATTHRGLRRDSPPMRLYEKAKRLGLWNPSDIDFSKDQADWGNLADDERDLILRLTAMFVAGEEAVTLNLLPLIMVIAEEGRIEEELYLTSFLFEEGKHTDFFNRFLTEVAGVSGDLRRYHTPNYRSIIARALPDALRKLCQDSSPAAQARAVVTYNMIVEGVLAGTGYQVYSSMLERSDLLPGQRQGISYVKKDEARHMAYGVFLLSRLLAEDDSLWEVIENRMNALLMPAVGVVREFFSRYAPVPFGLCEDEFADYAMTQFQKRMERIQKARGASLDEIYRVTHQAIDQDDA